LVARVGLKNVLAGHAGKIGRETAAFGYPRER